MSVEDVREYERKLQEQTNLKVNAGLTDKPEPLQHTESVDSTGSGDEFTLASEDLEVASPTGGTEID